MKNIIIEELENKFAEECGFITIGDLAKTRLINPLEGEELSLENILISVYNLIKVNKTRIKTLETNLELLTNRVFDTTEEFSEDEIFEIRETLSTIRDEEDFENAKYYMEADTFFLIEDIDEETRREKAEILINKIDFPNKKMHDTFTELVEEAHSRWKKYNKKMLNIKYTMGNL